MIQNTILSALTARKSVRVFTGDPITADERGAILHAAFQAPTAGNQQLYTILDITDPALKATLADLCDHQPFIAKAPLVLWFLGRLPPLAGTPTMRQASRTCASPARAI